eukprot:scaffold10750_cov34-Cyclotella_meneghiniana.AAC.3
MIKPFDTSTLIPMSLESGYHFKIIMAVVLLVIHHHVNVNTICHFTTSAVPLLLTVLVAVTSTCHYCKLSSDNTPTRPDNTIHKVIYHCI